MDIRELGGEGKSGELRLLIILQSERLEADEAAVHVRNFTHKDLDKYILFASVGANAGIRGEGDGRLLGNIDAGLDGLKESLRAV